MSTDPEKNAFEKYTIGFHVDRNFLASMPKEMFFHVKESEEKLIEIEKPENGGMQFKSSEGEYALTMGNADLYI